MVLWGRNSVGIIGIRKCLVEWAERGRSRILEGPKRAVGFESLSRSLANSP